MNVLLKKKKEIILKANCDLYHVSSSILPIINHLQKMPCFTYQCHECNRCQLMPNQVNHHAAKTTPLLAL